jgi:hypothetical protein
MANIAAKTENFFRAGVEKHLLALIKPFTTIWVDVGANHQQARMAQFA